MKEAAATFDEALQVVRSIKDPLVRGTWLSEIAESQAKAGLLKESEVTFYEALLFVRSVEHEHRERVSIRISEAFANAGKITEAFEVVQSIVDVRGTSTRARDDWRGASEGRNAKGGPRVNSVHHEGWVVARQCAPRCRRGTQQLTLYYCPRLAALAKRRASSAARNSAFALLMHSCCSKAGSES